jgi:hypothetical protein
MVPQPPDLPADPLVGLALAAVAVNALSAYLAYRLARAVGSGDAERAPADGRGRSSGEQEDDVTVECLECSTENEPGYRYCRECVAELPGSIGFERTGSGTADRLVR